MLFRSTVALLASVLLAGCAGPGYSGNRANVYGTPPAKYVRAYKGSLDLEKLSAAEAHKLCYGHDGCAWVAFNHCNVKVNRESPHLDDLIEHEMAHCNGWPGSHPAQ